MRRADALATSLYDRGAALLTWADAGPRGRRREHGNDLWGRRGNGYRKGMRKRWPVLAFVASMVVAAIACNESGPPPAAPVVVAAGDGGADAQRAYDAEAP